MFNFAAIFVLILKIGYQNGNKLMHVKQNSRCIYAPAIFTLLTVKNVIVLQ